MKQVKTICDDCRTEMERGLTLDNYATIIIPGQTYIYLKREYQFCSLGCLASWSERNAKKENP